MIMSAETTAPVTSSVDEDFLKYEMSKNYNKRKKLSWLQNLLKKLWKEAAVFENWLQTAKRKILIKERLNKFLGRFKLVIDKKNYRTITVYSQYIGTLIFW